MLIHPTFNFDQECKFDMNHDARDGSSDCKCVHLVGVASPM